MRCHFNFSAGDDFLIDEVGVEVASIDHAHVEALQAIQEVSRGTDSIGFDWSAWTLNVTDSTGHVLLTVPLQQVIGEPWTLH
jgi:hypothetical protein